MVRVKICGITRVGDALAAIDAGADLLGLNFYPGSKRVVSTARAAEIVGAVAGRVPVVGVFVNASRQEIQRVRRQVALGVLQLHGEESPEFCQAWDLPVIKAFRLRGPGLAEEACRYDVKWVLADAYVEGEHGGTGCRLPIEWVAGLDPGRLILAGGLRPDNVREVLGRLRPYGVDVASGVESAPGLKDERLIRRFIENVRAT